LETLTTDGVGQCGEATAFGVGESQALRVELGFEDAIFLLEVGNHLLLVPLEPAREHRDEDMENHSPSSG
jgi:hypothetical protein